MALNYLLSRMILDKVKMMMMTNMINTTCQNPTFKKTNKSIIKEQD
ncbi:hypothetical protein [Maribacter sp. 4G9]|nr:hypothetical protein [Maribacter sp. 4G9]